MEISKCFRHKYGEIYDYDWEYIMQFPEFQAMEKAEQNPKWHGEGNVMNHTRLVCANALKTARSEISFAMSFTNTDVVAFLMAALLHDVGKPSVAKIGKDGAVHHVYHDIDGEMIARRMLWNEDIRVRESICSLIRYHMDVLKIADREDVIESYIRMSRNVNMKLLVPLKVCDIMGSMQKGGGTVGEDLARMRFIADIGKMIGPMPVRKLFDSMNQNHIMEYEYMFSNKMLPWAVEPSASRSLILMIGLPGSGKNTYVQDHFNPKYGYEILSYDDIRIEMGIMTDDEHKAMGTKDQEKEVKRRFIERLKTALEGKNDIVVNNTNLIKKYRDEIKDICKGYNLRITYVYVEAPSFEDNLERRKGTVRPDVFEGMVRRFNFPRADECHILRIQKEERHDSNYDEEEDL